MSRRRKAHDPMEAMIREALDEAGMTYSEEGQPGHPHALDFHLLEAGPDGVAVEVKQMHTSRVADQMATREDVIVAQGTHAVRLLADLIVAVGRQRQNRNYGQEKTMTDTRPIAEAPRDGSFVMLRFRDPQDVDHAPADVLARHERGVDGMDRWRIVGTHATVDMVDADGWSFREPAGDEAGIGEDAIASLNAAAAADDEHDDAKRRNRLPWQKALQARAQAAKA